MRTLLILIAITGALLILRHLAKQSPAAFKKIFLKAMLGVGIVLFVFLLITGRLHWLFALIAAALPFLYRMLPLLRHVPWLYGLYKRYKNRQQNSQGSSAGQASTVTSPFLKMSLNLDSGDMDGEVLQGGFKGKYLHELTMPQLLQLLGECRDDEESTALLMAYLDRMHEDWSDQAGSAYQSEDAHQRQSPQAGGKMSKQEAYDILGLSEGASEQDIVAAHRRLMQKVHPDHGGSNYLAAKINLAKELLLKLH